MWYLINDDGYFLFCFDRFYTSSKQEDGFQYFTKRGAEKDIHHYGLSGKFKAVYIGEK